MINVCIPKKYMRAANDISRAQRFTSVKDWAESEVLSIIKENLNDYGYNLDGDEINE